MRWPQVGPRGGRPVVLQPGAELAVPVGVIQVAHDRAERDGGTRPRPPRPGPERLAQRPHRGAQARAGCGLSGQKRAASASRLCGPGCSARNANSRRCSDDSGTRTPSRSTAIPPRSCTDSTR